MIRIFRHEKLSCWGSHLLIPIEMGISHVFRHKNLRQQKADLSDQSEKIAQVR